MEVDTSEDCMGNFYIFLSILARLPCVCYGRFTLQQTESSPDGFVCVAIEATSNTTIRISENHLQLKLCQPSWHTLAGEVWHSPPDRQIEQDFEDQQLWFAKLDSRIFIDFRHCLC